MRLFGLEITRIKAGPPQLVGDRGLWWWPAVMEPFSGAWQRNITQDKPTIMAHHAVFACMTLIASDISKLRVKFVEQDANGIWLERESPAYSPVLRKPNSFQTRNQFWESWLLSKLSNGNTYVLKRRDQRNVVTGLWVLDPCRVKVLVSDSGDVFYELSTDNTAGIANSVTAPARDIIHDRWNCLFHPLCGLSPIFANALASAQGLAIQKHALKFFGDDAMPRGVLTAAAKISDITAARLMEDWNKNFRGENAPNVAVLGDGLKFEKMSMAAEESQLIEQLKWTAEVVCSTFHVPPYKIGVGALPSYNNVQALNVEYYSQCLQTLIEAAETCLDEGLEISKNAGTEFDLENLLRMDTVTQAEVADKLGKAGIQSPNEGRAKFGMAPTAGGDTPYLQQQNYSLAALAKRDAKPDPFASAEPPAALPPAENDDEQATKANSRAALEIFDSRLARRLKEAA